MFILDNKPLPIDTPFEHDGVRYPANWLRLATQEERAAIGITEVVEQPRPDDRFYWVSGPNEDGSWTAIPKDLDGLKADWTAQMQQTAYSMLLPSDWMVVRNIETQAPISAEWTTYRADVRAKAQEVIADLEGAQNIDDFISAVTTVEWPLNPTQPGA